MLWNLPFFKMVPPKTNFWLVIVQQTSIHINCFMAGKWYTLCHPISKMHIVGEGPGETPTDLRCLSYLINNFLTDVKQLAKTSKGTLFPSPSGVYVRSFLYLYYTLIKFCYTKSSQKSSLVSGPWIEIISSGSHKSQCATAYNLNVSLLSAECNAHTFTEIINVGCHEYKFSGRHIFACKN